MFSVKMFAIRHMAEYSQSKGRPSLIKSIILNFKISLIFLGTVFQHYTKNLAWYQHSIVMQESSCMEVNF